MIKNPSSVGLGAVEELFELVAWKIDHGFWEADEEVVSMLAAACDSLNTPVRAGFLPLNKSELAPWTEQAELPIPHRLWDRAVLEIAWLRNPPAASD